MKNIWANAVLIPVGVAIVVAACIVGVGEFYLALGENAIFAALPLMCIIMIIAAVLVQRTETGSKA